MATALEKALAGSPRVGIFFRLHVAPIVRLWLGIGNCEAGIDVTDGASATYNGLGEMADLPAFAQLVNGAADRVQFHLSGVSLRVLQLASDEADEVKGVALLVGLGVFGDDWQLVATPTWLRRFTVDYLTVEMVDLGGEQGKQRTVTLSARTLLTGRRRPGLSYFTDHDQQEKSPGDRFCERSSLYSNDVSKVWPRF